MESGSISSQSLQATPNTNVQAESGPKKIEIWYPGFGVEPFNCEDFEKTTVSNLKEMLSKRIDMDVKDFSLLAANVGEHHNHANPCLDSAYLAAYSGRFYIYMKAEENTSGWFFKK